MKRLKAVQGLKLVLTITVSLTLFGGECDFQEVPTPGDDEENKACMSIEYDWMDEFDIGNKHDIRTPIDAALEEANTLLNPQRDDTLTHRLPFYISGQFSSRFPNTNASELRDYARREHHSVNGSFMDYHFLSVNFADENAGNEPKGILGTSVIPLPYSHQVANNRFSFVYYGDIVELTNTLSEERQASVYATIHELGHQRYGLMHFQGTGYNDHHNQEQDWCVMQFDLELIPEANRNALRFCSSDDDNNSNSCIDWLKQAN